jgi:hypothetical protein
MIAWFEKGGIKDLARDFEAAAFISLHDLVFTLELDEKNDGLAIVEAEAKAPWLLAQKRMADAYIRELRDFNLNKQPAATPSKAPAAVGSPATTSPAAKPADSAATPSAGDADAAARIAKLEAELKLMRDKSTAPLSQQGAGLPAGDGAVLPADASAPAAKPATVPSTGSAPATLLATADAPKNDVSTNNENGSAGASTGSSVVGSVVSIESPRGAGGDAETKRLLAELATMAREEQQREQQRKQLEEDARREAELAERQRVEAREKAEKEAKEREEKEHAEAKVGRFAVRACLVSCGVCVVQHRELRVAIESVEAFQKYKKRLHQLNVAIKERKAVQFDAKSDPRGFKDLFLYYHDLLNQAPAAPATAKDAAAELVAPVLLAVKGHLRIQVRRARFCSLLGDPHRCAAHSTSRRRPSCSSRWTRPPVWATRNSSLWWRTRRRWRASSRATTRSC